MNSERTLRRLGTVLCTLMLGAFASACASTADAKSAPTTHAPVTTAKKPNPYYDAGDTVTITPTRFEPRVLIATVNVPLHFVNHTKIVQHVQFEHSRGADGELIRSAAIAPGGTWSYTPQSWESATYHSIDQPSLHGQIQIQPPAEP